MADLPHYIQILKTLGGTPNLGEVNNRLEDLKRGYSLLIQCKHKNTKKVIKTRLRLFLPSKLNFDRPEGFKYTEDKRGTQ